VDKRLLWSLLLRDVIVEGSERLLVGQILLMHKLPKLLCVRAHQMHRLIVDVLLIHMLVVMHLALIDVVRDHALPLGKLADHVSVLQQVFAKICGGCLRNSIAISGRTVFRRQPLQFCTLFSPHALHVSSGKVGHVVHMLLHRCRCSVLVVKHLADHVHIGHVCA